MLWVPFNEQSKRVEISVKVMFYIKVMLNFEILEITDKIDVDGIGLVLFGERETKKPTHIGSYNIRKYNISDLSRLDESNECILN